MVLLAIIGCVIIIDMFLVFYFFSLAFMRHESEDIVNIETKINNSIEEYKNKIFKGLKYIDEHPHEWVYTQSFDDLKLAARYYDCGSDKTIILFHGYRSSAARDFSCAVEMYCNDGFNVLLVDQRSHGRSQGKLITFGVKEQKDVLTWVNFVLQKYGTDTRILLGGMSMGSTTVLLSSGLSMPQNVKGIIADCGFTSPVDIIKKVARQVFNFNAAFIIPFLNILCKFFGQFSLYGATTVESLKLSKIPVLFIHGASDNFVPCEMSKLAYESARCEKQILLVDKADHGFSFLLDSKGVTNAINKFITSHLN